MALKRMVGAKQDGHLAARMKMGKWWKMAKIDDLRPGLHFLSLHYIS